MHNQDNEDTMDTSGAQIPGTIWLPEHDPKTPFEVKAILGPVGLHIPSTGSDATLRLATDAEAVKATRNQADYINTILESSTLGMTRDALSSLATEEWDDHIPSDKGELRTYSHQPSVISGRRISGRQATMRARARVGGGVPTPTVLPHSGFWITYLPPGEAELSTLWSSIAQDRISLGRYTYGAIFSATSIITRRRILEFCRKHMEATSVKIDGDDLFDLMLVTDEPMIYNGMGLAIHPRGIKYRMACVADPVTCQHETEGLMHPDKLQRYDWRRIPLDYRNVVTSATKDSVTIEAVLNYQQAVFGNGKQFKVLDEDNIETLIYLKVPTINRALRMGGAWINDIHDGVIEALTTEGMNMTTEESWTVRDEMITRHGQASFLSQYGAWITMIDMGDDGYVDSEADIIAVLGDLSSSNQVRAQITQFIEAYIASMTIGVIGVPTYDCPSCHRPAALQKDGVLALDPTRLFFKYLVAKVNRVATRSLT